MVSLLILAITMILTAIVVRVGAIAFELSGLPPEQAGFQALSSFTGVGFTTRESELILATPERRRIAVFLIRIGGAGVVVTIAALAGAIANGDDVKQELLVAHPEVTLLVVVIFLVGIYGMTKVSPVRRFLDEVIAKWVLHKNLAGANLLQVLHVDAEGSSLLLVPVDQGSKLLGRRIADLKERGIQPLLLDRGSSVLENPSDDVELRDGEHLIIRAGSESLTELGGKPTGSGADHEAGLLAVGVQAPELHLPDQFGNIFELSAYRGKAVILLFYVKNNCILCSRILSEYEPFMQSLRNRNVVFVAVNPASVESHASFARSLGDHYLLLSDEDKKSAKEYGALMFGGLRIDRVVYVIDPTGKVSWRKRGWPRAAEVVGAAHAFASNEHANISKLI